MTALSDRSHIHHALSPTNPSSSSSPNHAQSHPRHLRGEDTALLLGPVHRPLKDGDPCTYPVHRLGTPAAGEGGRPLRMRGRSTDGVAAGAGGRGGDRAEDSTVASSPSSSAFSIGDVPHRYGIPRRDRLSSHSHSHPVRAQEGYTLTATHMTPYPHLMYHDTIPRPTAPTATMTSGAAEGSDSGYGNVGSAVRWRPWFQTRRSFYRSVDEDHQPVESHRLGNANMPFPFRAIFSDDEERPCSPSAPRHHSRPPRPSNYSFHKHKRFAGVEGVRFWAAGRTVEGNGNFGGQGVWSGERVRTDEGVFEVVSVDGGKGGVVAVALGGQSEDIEMGVSGRVGVRSGSNLPIQGVRFGIPGTSPIDPDGADYFGGRREAMASAIVASTQLSSLHPEFSPTDPSSSLHTDKRLDSALKGFGRKVKWYDEGAAPGPTSSGRWTSTLSRPGQSSRSSLIGSPVASDPVDRSARFAFSSNSVTDWAPRAPSPALDGDVNSGPMPIIPIGPYGSIRVGATSNGNASGNWSNGTSQGRAVMMLAEEPVSPRDTSRSGVRLPVPRPRSRTVEAESSHGARAVDGVVLQGGQDMQDTDADTGSATMGGRIVSSPFSISPQLEEPFADGFTSNATTPEETSILHDDGSNFNPDKDVLSPSVMPVPMLSAGSDGSIGSVSVVVGGVEEAGDYFTGLGGRM